jgi:hypothetical protein
MIDLPVSRAVTRLWCLEQCGLITRLEVTMADPILDPAPPRSVRELIAELAEVEDAVRALPTHVEAADGSAVPNPELLCVLDRERDILAALRGIDLHELSL